MNTTPRRKDKSTDFGNISFISGRASNAIVPQTPQYDISDTQILPEYDQVVDASYMDIENILECLRSGSKITRQSKMTDSASQMLNQKLLACFEEICQQVQGFSQITSNSDEITQNLIRQALTEAASEGQSNSAAFQKFDEFEYVIFRLVNKAQQDMAQLKQTFLTKYKQTVSQLRLECIRTIQDEINNTELYLSEKQKTKLRHANGGRIPIQIEQKTSTPTKAVSHPAEDSKKLISLGQLSLEQLLEFMEVVHQRKIDLQEQQINQLLS